MKPELVRYQGVVPPDGIPEIVRHPELAGIFIGGCVERGVGSSFRAMAHAHIEGEHLGWICIRGWRRLYQKSLLLHELAHVLTRQGHTDKWRRKLRELGGRVPASCQKQKRELKPCACGAHRFGNEGARWFAADNKVHSWKGCRVALSSPSNAAPSPAQVQGETYRTEEKEVEVEGKLTTVKTKVKSGNKAPPLPEFIQGEYQPQKKICTVCGEVRATKATGCGYADDPRSASAA